VGRTRFEQVLRLSKPVRVSGPLEGRAGQRVDDGSAPVGVPSRCRVRHVLSGSRCATRLAPSRWTGFLIAMTHEHGSGEPRSPRHHRRPGLPGECCAGTLGPGFGHLRAGRWSGGHRCRTSAVEHTAAEHALVLELARPRGWFRLAGRRRRNAPDRGRAATTGTRGGPETRLLEVVADGCAWSTTTPTTTRPETGTPSGWYQLRTGHVSIVCGHRGSADRVSNSSYRR
jgi:hypothetical protein